MDDLYSILGEPYNEAYRRIFLGEDFDEQDLIVSENIMNYYSNFVRTGWELIKLILDEWMNEWMKKRRRMGNITRINI